MPPRTTRPSSIASTSSASRTCSTRWKSPNWCTIDLEHDNQPTHITKDFYNHASAQYAPDGRSIVYISTPPGQEHPGPRAPQRDLDDGRRWLQSARLLDRKEYSFNSPRFTPDGASLIVSGSQTDEPTYRQAHLARFDLKDNKLTWLTEKWDSSARGGKVSADGSVLFTTPWHGGEPLLRVSVKGGKSPSWWKGPPASAPLTKAAAASSTRWSACPIPTSSTSAKRAARCAS